MRRLTKTTLGAAVVPGLASLAMLLVATSPAGAGNPRSAFYSADPSRIFWFIHISDTHIGTRGSTDSGNLSWVLSTARSVIAQGRYGDENRYRDQIAERLADLDLVKRNAQRRHAQPPAEGRGRNFADGDLRRPPGDVAGPRARPVDEVEAGFIGQPQLPRVEPKGHGGRGRVDD